MPAPQLPERFRNPRSVVLLAVGGVVALILGVWVLVAVLVPTVEDAPCAGVQFHAPVESVPGGSDAQPPIGGDGGFAGRVRSLFGEGDVVYCQRLRRPVRAARRRHVLRVLDEHRRGPCSRAHLGRALRHGRTPRRAARAPGLVRARIRLGTLGAAAPRGLHPLLLDEAAGFADGVHLVRVGQGARRSVRGLDHRDPFICPAGGGAIDPEPFVDANGTVYLLWKNYTSGAGANGIVAQQLAPDGLSLVGPQQLIAQADQPWEAGIVEAPTMLAADGRYFLFYSGNDWDTANYAISYAVCTTPMGPCVKPNAGPWLTGSPTAQGPGSPSVFTDEQGETWLALHSWVGARSGTRRARATCSSSASAS